MIAAKNLNLRNSNGINQLGWLRIQSDANPSLPANWEMQGDFDEMQGEQ
jgi:hypothetical protein